MRSPLTAGERFVRWRARVDFFAGAKKSNQKKAPSPMNLQLAIGYDAGIATLGILRRVATAHFLCAALRVSQCDSASEFKENRLGKSTLTRVFAVRRPSGLSVLLG